MRTLTRYVVAWAGRLCHHLKGLAAHRRVNTASRRVQPPGPLQVRTPTRPPLGGIARHEAPTHRRHAARGLHVVQKPRRFLHVGRHLNCDTRLPCRHTRHNSPGTTPPPLTREKTRPTPPLQPHFREKVRPARHKPPIFGHFSHAGRTFSRSHPPSDHAGRTFSRTGSCDVMTLKPTTPLQPLMQTNVKPPSPMQPKTTPKTPISHPQRR